MVPALAPLLTRNGNSSGLDAMSNRLMRCIKLRPNPLKNEEPSASEQWHDAGALLQTLKSRIFLRLRHTLP